MSEFLVAQIQQNNNESNYTQDENFTDLPDSNRNAFISAKVYGLIEDIVDLGLVSVLSCAGVISSTLNLVVFAKQGYKDGVNVSMTYITCWDMVKCTAAILHKLYLPISLVSVNYGRSWKNITAPLAIYLSLFSGYVSSVLTSYVSLERCFCVILPFRVKDVSARRTTLAATSFISVFIFGMFFVMFCTHDVIYVRDALNITMYLDDIFNSLFTSNLIVRTYYKTAATVVPLTSFVVLCVSSLTTIVSLRRSEAGIHKYVDKDVKIAGKNPHPALSRRQKQVTRTLLVFIFVYIVCMFPRIAAVDIPTFFSVEYYALRKYHDLYMTVSMFLFVLDFSHTSINFIIFYKTSSHYRKTLRVVFVSKHTGMHPSMNKK